MQSKTVTWVAVIAFGIGMALPISHPFRTVAAAVPQPAAQPAAEPGLGREAHPQIRAALRALENARDHLQRGAHDFGGHRARALQLADQAIQECQAALQYDRH